MREGPKVTTVVKVSCEGCKFLSSQKYICQSDWDYDYFCSATAKAEGKSKFIGDGHTDTPDWCPYREEGIK